MTGRDDILARVRTALGDHRGTVPLDVPRDYGAEGPLRGEDLLDQLVERLVDYRAGVHRTGTPQVTETIRTALAAAFARRAGGAPTRPRIVVPVGLERSWLSDDADADVVVDDELTIEALDRCDAVVTAATVAIAETGTIVLDGSPDQGRRAITLVPDVHVCVVRGDQVVGRVPEAMHRLDPTRPLTWISGPSATSDIELERVEGVHGPRNLEVVIVGP